MMKAELVFIIIFVSISGMAIFGILIAAFNDICYKDYKEKKKEKAQHAQFLERMFDRHIYLKTCSRSDDGVPYPDYVRKGDFEESTELIEGIIEYLDIRKLYDVEKKLPKFKKKKRREK